MGKMETLTPLFVHFVVESSFVCAVTGELGSEICADKIGRVEHETEKGFPHGWNFYSSPKIWNAVVAQNGGKQFYGIVVIIQNKYSRYALRNNKFIENSEDTNCQFLDKRDYFPDKMTSDNKMAIHAAFRTDKFIAGSRIQTLRDKLCDFSSFNLAQVLSRK